MKHTISFLCMMLFCIQHTQTSWHNFWHPLIWWGNRLSADIKEIITQAANAPDTDEARTSFAQALSTALDKHPDDIQKGSLLLRIYKYCYKKNKENAPMAYTLLKIALEKGANPNTRGRKDKGIVLKASAYQDPILTDILIRHGANFMIQDKHGAYLFHAQVQNGNKNMVDVLLKQKEIVAQIDIADAQGQTALLIATKNGFKDIVHTLLEHNAHPDVSDQQQTTALHAAVQVNANDIVQLLLEYNANPNLCDQQNIPPLHIAIKQNNTDLVTKLIAHNATVNIFDTQSNSALLCACKQCNDEIIKILLSHGADTVINKGNKQGEYPLFIVMQHLFKRTSDHYQNCLATFKTLLDHGADTRLKEGSGHTLFTLASKHNAIALMDILKAHDPDLLDEPDQYGNTPLHHAAHDGAYDMVQYLIHYGTQVDKTNKLGQTPLLMAMEHNQSDIATLLLAAGATVKQVDHNGNTIWHYLALANNAMITCNQIIIDEGASLINVKNNEDNTPLHIVTYNGNIALLQFLLDMNVQLDVINKKQQTALHIAAQRSCDTLKILLQKNTNSHLINAQDSDGNTPVHCAAAAGNVTCLKLLLDKQAAVDMKNNNGQTPFMLSSKNLKIATARVLLLSKIVNPNRSDNQGYAAIHQVTRSGKVSILREFLHMRDCAYINIDKQTKFEKYTALHIATIQEYVDCVELLIKAGAHVNARDKQGNTPLHYASHTNAAICRLLLNSPAINPNLPNDKSETPLHLAIQNCKDNCIDVLLKHNKVDPNSLDAASCSPLYYAVNSLYPTAYTQKLLQHENIHINELKPQVSSLHTAFDKGDDALLTTLLSDSRIDLDFKNKDGFTIWQRAQYANQIQKLLTIAKAICDSGEIPWSHSQKIKSKINEFKNPPPTNPEYKEDVKQDDPAPTPLYPELPPTVAYDPNAKPSAPPDNRL